MTGPDKWPKRDWLTGVNFTGKQNQLTPVWEKYIKYIMVCYILSGHTREHTGMS